MFTSFEEITDNYDVIFFDAFGVLKSYSGVFDGVHELLFRLKKRGKEIFVLTNDSSRSPALMARAYSHPQYGELVPSSRIIPSGLLAADFLMTKVRTGNVAYLGKQEAAYYVELAGLTPIPLVDCEDEHAPKALALLDDEGFDWFTCINKAINMVRRLNVPVIVANADTAYPVKGNEVAVAVGGLADVMEGVLRKSFIRFGKPDPMMFAYAYSQVLARKPDCSKRKILMVGDTLRTDILGANKFGLDTALVLTGTITPEHAEIQIQATGIVPDFVCESVLT